MAFRIHSFLPLLPLSVLLGAWGAGGLFPRNVHAAPLSDESNSFPVVQLAQTHTQVSQAVQVAQNSQIVAPNCYWSTLQMGVYQEPNTQSTAIGVLPAGAIVFIGPGSGQGWVRLQSPVVGWMATMGLQANPLQGCNGLGSIVPVGGTPPTSAENSSGTSSGTSSDTPSATSPIATPDPSQKPSKAPVLCTVVPPSGLAVRNQPILHPRTLTAILEPGLHRFQFSDRQARLESFNQVRDWFYITAPVSGWISPRVVGNPTVDLSGEGCL